MVKTGNCAVPEYTLSTKMKPTWLESRSNKVTATSRKR